MKRALPSDNEQRVINNFCKKNVGLGLVLEGSSENDSWQNKSIEAQRANNQSDSVEQNSSLVNSSKQSVQRDSKDLKDVHEQDADRRKVIRFYSLDDVDVGQQHDADVSFQQVPPQEQAQLHGNAAG